MGPRRKCSAMSGSPPVAAAYCEDTLTRFRQWRTVGQQTLITQVWPTSSFAISRLPDNRHWLSDVVFGSTVGIVAGRTVTRHGRAFPVAVTSVPGGVAILYVRHGN
jgi:hypothetical protein